MYQHPVCTAKLSIVLPDNTEEESAACIGGCYVRRVQTLNLTNT